jgi:hypothetical protein
MPKKWPNRSAVSPVMARWPFTMPVIRYVGTSTLRASYASLILSAFSSSASCSPG